MGETCDVWPSFQRYNMYMYIYILAFIIRLIVLLWMEPCALLLAPCCIQYVRLYTNSIGAQDAPGSGPQLSLAILIDHRSQTFIIYMGLAWCCTRVYLQHIHTCLYLY
jgi:hypothetical protein